jgi:hypothetical protein
VTRTYCCKFQAGFPDDGRWDDSGHVISPSGRNVADAIVAGLRLRGFEVSTPENHEDFGWEFQARRDRVRLWALLQFPEPPLLIVEPSVPLLDSFRRGAGARKQAALDAVRDGLTEDGRFHEVRWFTRAEYETAIRERTR